MKTRNVSVQTKNTATIQIAKKKYVFMYL